MDEEQKKRREPLGVLLADAVLLFFQGEREGILVKARLDEAATRPLYAQVEKDEDGIWRLENAAKQIGCTEYVKLMNEYQRMKEAKADME